MSQTATEYVQNLPNGGWRVGETRVSLDSIVHAYWDGKSPEAIAEEFPTITAEQVYGVIAFYLHNKPEIDQYLSEQNNKWQQLSASSDLNNGPLLNRLRHNRRPSSAE